MAEVSGKAVDYQLRTSDSWLLTLMHILIVKLSSIGDVVHAMPAVAALRQSFPAARLTWVVERIAAPLIVGSPMLDEVIVLDTRGWRRSFAQRATWNIAWQKIKALRRVPVDIALDFQGLMKSALVARLTGATERIGFSTHALREPASRLGYTRQVLVDNTRHVIENNLALTYAIGAKRPERFEFPFPSLEEPSIRIEEQLDCHGIERFAIVNPGGGWVTKLWPAVEYARLADILWERFGLKSVVTCGPGEEPLARSITTQSYTQSAVFFPTTLLEFVALARRAELFVGSDTGPLHLAAACQTPIVGIYGPTAPERNGPFDPADQTVGREIPCRINCHRRTCGNHICMDISLDVVAQAVEKRLQSRL